MSHNLPLIIASRRVARASSLAPSFSSSLSFLSIGQFSTQVLYYSRVKTETKKVTWASVSLACARLLYNDEAGSAALFHYCYCL